MFTNLRKFAGDLADLAASAAIGEFTETPGAPRNTPAVVRFPRESRKWHVEFESIQHGRPQRFAVEIECERPVDRKEAERAVRKSVHQRISRFAEFHPLA